MARRRPRLPPLPQWHYAFLESPEDKYPSRMQHCRANKPHIRRSILVEGRPSRNEIQNPSMPSCEIRAYTLIGAFPLMLSISNRKSRFKNPHAWLPFRPASSNFLPCRKGHGIVVWADRQRPTINRLQDSGRPPLRRAERAYDGSLDADIA